jgi:hypothetical protein
MKPQAIFQPMSVLALWTLLVLGMTGFRRVWAVRQRRVRPGAFRLGEAADVPADVTVVNRNFMNLLEAPVLFYVVSLAFYVSHATTPRVLALAWIYVALRLLHSLIHLSWNHIVSRLIAFTASNVVLFSLWIALIRRVAAH